MTKTPSPDTCCCHPLEFSQLEQPVPAPGVMEPSLVLAGIEERGGSLDNLDVGIPAPGRLLHSQPCSRYFPMIYCNPNGAAEGNWQGWDGGGEGLITLGVTERLAPTGSPTGAGFRSSGIGCAVPGGGGNDNKLNNNEKLPMFPAIPGALFLVQIPRRRGLFCF